YKIRTKRRADDATRFRLEVVYDKDSVNVTVEAFENLSLTATDTRSAWFVINSGSDFITVTVTDDTKGSTDQTTALANGNDGKVSAQSSPDFPTALNGSTCGVALLAHVDLFNLLCVPGETDPTTLTALQKVCRDRRAFLIADCDQTATFNSMKNGPTNL